MAKSTFLLIEATEPRDCGVATCSIRRGKWRLLGHLGGLFLVAVHLTAIASGEPPRQRDPPGNDIGQPRAGELPADPESTAKNLSEKDALLAEVARQELSFGLGAVEVIPALNGLANYFIDEEQYAKAMPQLERALSISELRTGIDSVTTAEALQRRAVLLDRMHLFNEAEASHKQSLQLFVNLFGDDSPEAATAFFAYALNCEGRENNVLALKYLMKTISIRERVFTSENLVTADAYMKLGLFYVRREDPANAELYISRALGIRSRLVDVIGVANSENALAELFQTTGRFKESRTLQEDALAIFDREYGPDSDASMSVRRDLGESYRSIGDYSRAAELFSRNLAYRNAATDADLYDQIADYDYLGDAYNDSGRYDLALESFSLGLRKAESAIGSESTWTRPLGADHVAMAQLLNHYGRSLSDSERFAEAEPMLMRAFSAMRQLQESIPEESAALVANVLFDLADVYETTGKPKLALSTLQDVLRIRISSLGPSHHNTANAHLKLSEVYEFLGNIKESEEHIRLALSAFEGKHTGMEATTMAALATLYADTGRFTEGEVLMHRAIDLRVEVSGRDSYRTAAQMANLGSMYRDVGNYRSAEQLERQAVRISAAELGADSLALAPAYNNLALTLSQIGADEEAERLFEHSNQIRLSHLGSSSWQYANGLESLANFYVSHGANDRAKKLYEQALSIYEAVFGKTHPLVARSLVARASLDRRAGSLADAEKKLTQALEIYGSTLGRDHHFYFSTLGHIASLMFAEGDFARAEQLFTISLSGERKRGEGNSSVLGTMENLAVVLRVNGKLREARDYANRTLEIRKQALGELSSDTGDSHYQLALIEWAAENPPKAEVHFKAAFEAYEATSRALFAIGDERRKLDYARSLDKATSAAVSFALDNLSNPGAVATAYQALLQRKGRVLDAVGRRHPNVAFNPSDAKYINTWRSASAEYAKLTFGSASDNPELQSKIRAAIVASSEAEEEVYLHVSSMRKQLDKVSLFDVIDAIPKLNVLVEWIKFYPFNPHLPSRSDGAHYAAFVIAGKGSIRVVDLGDAADIERDVSDFNAAIRDPNSRLVISLAAGLNKQLVLPLELPRNATGIIFAPDGALNLLSFAPLVGKDKRFLIQSYDLSYVTSGRDLIRPRPAGIPNWSKMVIVANPDFGRSDGLSDVTGRLSRFRALSGTADEAIGIARQLRLTPAQVVVGENATKVFFEKLHSPSILHVATHAFFLPPPPSDSNSGEDPVDNPLVRAGLALANANLAQRAFNDGILTALELSALDLSETDLVVLSACDTGVGDASVGEGIFGLRRAVFMAGAKSQVVALWRVADNFAPKLMQGMYDAISNGMNTAAALRAAQLKMLDGPFKSPYYWANFIPLGSVQ